LDPTTTVAFPAEPEARGQTVRGPDIVTIIASGPDVLPGGGMRWQT